MALICLTSAGHAPGTTTSALALALAWPRPVTLLEADPSGQSSIMAGYLRGQSEHPGNVLDLVLAHREGSLWDALWDAALKLPDSEVRLIPGTKNPTLASRSLPPLWEPLADGLRRMDSTGHDVIVDAGRLGLVGAPEALLREADLTLLVTRTDLPGVTASHGWAKVLQERHEANAAAARLGLLLVGEGRPYKAKQVSKVVHLPVVADLAWDEESARVFSAGATPRRRRFEIRSLQRSVRSAVSTIRTALDPISTEQDTSSTVEETA